MSKPKLGIIDLQSNNLYSIYNSCKISGYNSKIISPSEKKLNYDIIIMPGVGAFKTGMSIIKKNHYREKILEYLSKPNSFIYGICLGMQMLFSKSHEFGSAKGLDLLKGEVKKLNKSKGVKTNMGWLKINIEKNDVLFPKKKFNDKYFYFVHSYYADPFYEENIYGNSYHQNKKFTSIVKKKKI